MSTKIQAEVILSKCREGKKIFGVRMENTSLGWKYNWAFKISDKRANAEEFENTHIVGDIYPDPEYPGCPYCRGNSFIICGNCGKLYCYNEKNGVSTCEWCGNTGRLSNYDGAGISSSGDI